MTTAAKQARTPWGDMTDEQRKAAQTLQPFPWRWFIDHGVGFAIAPPTLNGDCDYVAHTYTSDHADFIVTACNAHGELVARVAELEQYETYCYELMHGQGVTSDATTKIRAALKQTAPRAALAKIKE